MLIAGDMIGTGIFISTGAIAETLPTPAASCSCGCSAGCSLSRARSHAPSCRRACRTPAATTFTSAKPTAELMGFLSGWSSFLVTFSGAIAFLAVILNGFASFFFPALGSQDLLFSIPLPLIPISATVGTLFSMAVVLLLSGLHCLGVRQGTLTQNILTTLKIGALLAIIVFGVLFGDGNTSHFEPLFDWQKIGNFSLFRRGVYSGDLRLLGMERGDLHRRRGKRIRSTICRAL
jgi:amino acid transporter